ncbi:hypothetical protein B5K11_09685 [Rhizobium leguminosarum bv. trifolii]|uniref:hypothetical protein n=1 Tax=Rhizobium leguminosarum TaxID=384 RepID=UPI000E2E89BE|nr:hypothetical protein [Rhizobium leguminosarum]RFB95214.1 hypothetical protein B5K11_09685 [Rhizobium leguminosarum bv. trifolii]
MEVSKSEFAAMINVSPGRVSQFIAAGQISAAAIVGTGQRAKINVDRAKADLRLSLDVSQRLGNGSETRLDPEQDISVPLQQPAGTFTLPIAAGLDHEIKQQKLEQIRRVNRNAAIADAQARGQLIETDQARSEMGRIAAGMLQVFEGGLTDLASAIAAEFKVPQRDVLHLLRKQFRQIRATAARQMQTMSVAIPETAAVEIAAEDIESLN